MPREITGETFGEVRVVSDMHQRKAEMARQADAFIALPGGYGTLEELLEVITWAQLGIHSKPVDDHISFIGSVPSKGTTSSAKGGSSSAAGALSCSKVGSLSTAEPITKEKIRVVLLQKAPITTSDLVANFKARLKYLEVYYRLP
ncbi:hypothetical protein REPUB_Repub02eG0119500 [Reevesia pubescens]